MNGAAGTGGDAGGTVGGGGRWWGNTAGGGRRRQQRQRWRGRRRGNHRQRRCGQLIGTIGTGGIAGTIGGRGGGRGGTAGFGGAGHGGTTGRGGTGGNPCAVYPSGAKAFVTPTDGRTHRLVALQLSDLEQRQHNASERPPRHDLSAEENAFVVSVASSRRHSMTPGSARPTAGRGRQDRRRHLQMGDGRDLGLQQLGSRTARRFPPSLLWAKTCTCDHRAVLASAGTWNDRWQATCARRSAKRRQTDRAVSVVRQPPSASPAT